MDPRFLEIAVSKETLAHFRCGKCYQWWTIGDAPENKPNWYCPWCGSKHGPMQTKGTEYYKPQEPK